MKNRFRPKIILLFLVFTISSYAQIEYYGYWDCKQFFIDELNGKIDIPNNSGVASQWQYTNVVDNSLPGKKIIINLTDYFFYDENLNGRPDLEDVWDSEFAKKRLINLRDNVLQLNKPKYSNAALGLLIAEEPIIQHTKSITIKDRQEAEPIFKELEFVASGNFSNRSAFDDILLIYKRKEKRVWEIMIMKSAGNNIEEPDLCFRSTNSYYENNKLKYVAAGDYNGDSLSDLAIFYEQGSSNGIQIFYSNGDKINNNFYNTFNKTKEEYDFKNVKFVTSGNFDGIEGDEIAAFYQTEDTSYIHIISIFNNSYKVWFKKNTNEWNIDFVKYTVAANLDGGNNSKTSEIVVLYDYPSSLKSRVQVFRGNDEQFPTKFWGYENWLIKDYTEIDFNNVHGLLKGDINYDKNEDIILLYNTPKNVPVFGNSQRVLRFLSKPSEKEINKRFEYAGIWKYDYIKRNTSHSFDNIKFALSGEFLENNKHGDPYILKDSVWINNSLNNNKIDDLIYFWEYNKDHRRLECFVSRPHLMFGNKTVLQEWANEIKSVFNHPTMILYTEESTHIPDVFLQSIDWIGTDPYPFRKSSVPDYLIAKKRIESAVLKIVNRTNSNIFLVGQAANYRGNNLDALRFPSVTETNYYYEIALKYKRIKGLYWWWYPDVSNSTFDAVSSPGGEALLQQHKIIGKKIIGE